MSHIRRIQMLAFLCGMPAMVAALVLLAAGGYSAKVWLTVIILAGSCWLYFSLVLQARIVRPLQTAANMLSGLREGDFSLHPSNVDPHDPFGQVMYEINQLSHTLSDHRLGAMEAHVLLEKVVDEIDAAVFTFCPAGRLTLCNRAGVHLLGARRPEEVLGRHAEDLRMSTVLHSPPDAVVGHPLDRPGRFTIRRGTYRVGGEPHAILILIDVSQNLREEELQAWKRLIRVLGHELNNSMAPIKSIANSLAKLVRGDRPLEAEDRLDLVENLEIIETRADGLSRFVRDYARLAKLPPPMVRPVNFGDLVRSVAALCERICPEVDPESPELEIEADREQLEQLLINLIKNAVEATLEAHERVGSEVPPARVRVCWQVEDDQLLLQVEDEGPGIANPGNLFVPFFSTKKGGSGIGLTLSRQIAEAHGGSIRLENRTDVAHGCRAELRLPVSMRVPRASA